MITTRTFIANVGDTSTGNAGPDAIETDIDNLLANDQLLLADIGDKTTLTTTTKTNLVNAINEHETEINNKAPSANPTFTGTVVLPSTTSIGTVTNTEIGYLDGVTSAIQTQLDGKSGTGHTHNYAGSSSAGGAATSAVVLQTARTINGVSFNGSANITVSAAANGGNSDTVDSKHIWVGLLANKGTDANTIYFCY